jgi:hypothetical protein
VHVKLLVPFHYLEGLMSGRQLVVKVIAESLSQHYAKHVVPTPLSGIRVGRRRYGPTGPAWWVMARSPYV